MNFGYFTMGIHKAQNLSSFKQTGSKGGGARNRTQLIVFSSKRHNTRKHRKEVEPERKEEQIKELEYTYDCYNHLSQYRALVLDSAYQPVEIINWQRAICMDIVGKVDVLEYYDITVNSSRDEFFLPAVIRVQIYIQKLKAFG
eukprot:TRINITY_DN305_c2_g1_i6.p2 TRINITY_DN305_c2_g1~~TRINITY_DN305_c2_g1_i6.p2  ORF type:complete len:143 (-),score=11.00 TRINITY_DN305_c2_g1_i6:78-506(-)